MDLLEVDWVVKVVLEVLLGVWEQQVWFEEWLEVVCECKQNLECCIDEDLEVVVFVLLEIVGLKDGVLLLDVEVMECKFDWFKVECEWFGGVNLCVEEELCEVDE